MRFALLLRKLLWWAAFIAFIVMGAAPLVRHHRRHARLTRAVPTVVVTEIVLVNDTPTSTSAAPTATITRTPTATPTETYVPQTSCDFTWWDWGDIARADCEYHQRSADCVKWATDNCVHFCKSEPCHMSSSCEETCAAGACCHYIIGRG